MRAVTISEAWCQMPDADQLAKAVWQHWCIENQVHWCLGVTFADHQMRARTADAGHKMAILKRLTLNLIRLDPVKRKGASRPSEPLWPAQINIALIYLAWNEKPSLSASALQAWGDAMLLIRIYSILSR